MATNTPDIVLFVAMSIYWLCLTIYFVRKDKTTREQMMVFSFEVQRASDGGKDTSSSTAHGAATTTATKVKLDQPSGKKNGNDATGKNATAEDSNGEEDDDDEHKKKKKRNFFYVIGEWRKFKKEYFLLFVYIKFIQISCLCFVPDIPWYDGFGFITDVGNVFTLNSGFVPVDASDETKELVLHMFFWFAFILYVGYFVLEFLNGRHRAGKLDCCSEDLFQTLSRVLWLARIALLQVLVIPMCSIFYSWLNCNHQDGLDPVLHQAPSVECWTSQQLAIGLLGFSTLLVLLLLALQDRVIVSNYRNSAYHFIAKFRVIELACQFAMVALSVLVGASRPYFALGSILSLLAFLWATNFYLQPCLTNGRRINHHLAATYAGAFWIGTSTLITLGVDDEGNVGPILGLFFGTPVIMVLSYHLSRWRLGKLDLNKLAQVRWLLDHYDEEDDLVVGETGGMGGVSNSLLKARQATKALIALSMDTSNHAKLCSEVIDPLAELSDKMSDSILSGDALTVMSNIASSAVGQEWLQEHAIKKVLKMVTTSILEQHEEKSKRQGSFFVKLAQPISIFSRSATLKNAKGSLHEDLKSLTSSVKSLSIVPGAGSAPSPSPSPGGGLTQIGEQQQQSLKSISVVQQKGKEQPNREEDGGVVADGEEVIDKKQKQLLAREEEEKRERKRAGFAFCANMSATGTDLSHVWLKQLVKSTRLARGDNRLLHSLLAALWDEDELTRLSAATAIFNFAKSPVDALEQAMLKENNLAMLNKALLHEDIEIRLRVSETLMCLIHGNDENRLTMIVGGTCAYLAAMMDKGGLDEDYAERTMFELVSSLHSSQELKSLLQQAANRSIKLINKLQLMEVRSFSSPPATVALALKPVVLILEAKDGKPKTIERLTSWKQILYTLKNRFLERLANVEMDKIPASVVDHIRHVYFNHPDYTYDSIEKANKACAPLYSWVQLQLSFDRLLIELQRHTRLGAQSSSTPVSTNGHDEDAVIPFSEEEEKEEEHKDI